MDQTDLHFVSDIDIMRRIGKRIRTTRLNNNITRDELQIRTGVHKKTIGDAETGNNITMATLIAILRGLNMLDRLHELLRDEGISPVMIAKYQGKIPQRAAGGR